MKYSVVILIAVGMLCVQS